MHAYDNVHWSMYEPPTSTLITLLIVYSENIHVSMDVTEQPDIRLGQLSHLGV